MEDIQPTDARESYTILRIKRKRNEEPLDALVVEGKARRKRSKGALNVFQFAETVEEGAWDDEQRKKDIEARISTLAREGQKISSPSTNSQPPESTSLATSASASSVPSPARQPPIDPTRAYTVVPSTSQESSRSAGQSSAPPKVVAYNDLVAQDQHPAFTMYDAVPSSSSLATAPSGEVDREMEKFMPMLNEYLRLSENSTSTPLPSSTSLAKMATGDDDYVWDVFYQRPTTFQELYEPSVNNIHHIGTLSGLPAEADEWDSDDSEYEDEDDEDSNAEDWYTNDYPDEEESDNPSDGEDEFHEDSEQEEVYRDDGDLDWR